MPTAQEVADIFVEAWVSRRWIDDADRYPEEPQNVAELYERHLAIQQHPLVDQELGGLAGYKLGGIGAAGEMCIYAPLFGRYIVEAPGADLSAASIQMWQVEPEFCFVLGKDLPARESAEPYTVEEAWAAVEFVVICIECCGRRSSGDVVKVLSPLGRLTDSLSAGGAVLGPRLPAENFSPEALSSCGASLFVNETEVASGSGADCPGGGPVQALAWLANHLSNRGLSLSKGHIVLTGQTCNTKAFTIGDTISATFDGLGTISMTVHP
eukprot:TRINITY_DN22298_c0_g1_i1.p1 TRINITY_DN22298_c0_g1~~TRINITY_DN22298_c0_g1_i1.p1  ORF type:complete len:290 (-),score=51.65 TRINITY_DN22298_c0_g1_i1:112-915(-)